MFYSTVGFFLQYFVINRLFIASRYRKRERGLKRKKFNKSEIHKWKERNRYRLIIKKYRGRVKKLWKIGKESRKKRERKTGITERSRHRKREYNNKHTKKKRKKKILEKTKERGMEREKHFQRKRQTLDGKHTVRHLMILKFNDLALTTQT